MPQPRLESVHLKAIAEAVADAPGGLSHREITYVLKERGLPDEDAGAPKWVRLFNAFAYSLNLMQSTRGIITIIESAANPARFVYNPGDYESFRYALNKPLSLLGYAVTDSGKTIRSDPASTLPEAQRRAQELRADLQSRGVHPDVLAFCKAELVADNYFHAVLEASKSVAHKLRSRTGLLDDGAILVNHVFGGDKPLLAINGLRTKSERDEQKGFCNLIIGMFGMFRNPTAHEARTIWVMSKEDAEDLLSLVSLIHRRIDRSAMPSRV